MEKRRGGKMENQYKILIALAMCVAFFIWVKDTYPPYTAVGYVIMLIVFIPIAYFLDDTK